RLGWSSSIVVPAPSRRVRPPPTRRTSSGPREAGEDLMVIPVGEKVEVRRPSRSPPEATAVSRLTAFEEPHNGVERARLTMGNLAFLSAALLTPSVMQHRTRRRRGPRSFKGVT